MMREVLGPIELVAVLKLICRLTEHAPYPRLDATLFEVVIKSCLDLAAEERNPVIQVAVLSVSFSALCQHRSKEPTLSFYSTHLFQSMLLIARPDLSICAPSLNKLGMLRSS